jgi:hypothetical protein
MHGTNGKHRSWKAEFITDNRLDFLICLNFDGTRGVVNRLLFQFQYCPGIFRVKFSGAPLESNAEEEA